MIRNPNCSDFFVWAITRRDCKVACDWALRPRLPIHWLVCELGLDFSIPEGCANAEVVSVFGKSDGGWTEVYEIVGKEGIGGLSIDQADWLLLGNDQENRTWMLGLLLPYRCVCLESECVSDFQSHHHTDLFEMWRIQRMLSYDLYKIFGYSRERTFTSIDLALHSLYLYD